MDAALFAVEDDDDDDDGAREVAKILRDARVSVAAFYSASVCRLILLRLQLMLIMAMQ